MVLQKFRSNRQRSTAVASLCLAFLLPACTPDSGRPTLAPVTTSSVPSGVADSVDPGVQALTAVLTSSTKATFSATYKVTTKLGATEHEVKLSHDPDQFAITVALGTPTGIGLFGGGNAATCTGFPAICKSGIDERKLNELQITSTFWGPAAARSLNIQASRTTEPIATSKPTIAGNAATCVTVVIGVGTNAEFCALASGALARWDDPTRHIELTTFVTGVDPANFAPPAPVTR